MRDLTQGDPRKVMFQFALPILFGNIIQLLYSLVDTRIVGHTLGEGALAAVGATSTLNQLIIGFLIGLTNGFAIIVARDFGAQDMRSLRRNVANALKLGLIIAGVLTVTSLLFLDSILDVLNMPSALRADGTSYIRVIFMGMTCAMLYNICVSILRSIGDTITPLIFLVISAITNIGLDYFFILGLNWGVGGAAVATVISQTLAATLCMIYMWKKYEMLRIQWYDFKGDRTLYKLLLSTGISMGLMQSLVSFGTVALQGAINTLGTSIIVAHTTARKITELFMLPFSVLGMTMATYCGQNKGAHQLQRIKIGIKQAILVAWGWCVLVIIASYTVAPNWISFLAATSQSEIVEPATLYLRVDTLFYFVPAMISILRNALQGLGETTTPIVSSSIELIGKVLIAAFMTPLLKYWGIIIAEPIVWILMVIPLMVKINKLPCLKESKVTYSEPIG